MIRDEFKNVDKKVINKKANKKMQEMGERAYYAKKLSVYSEMLKPTKFSTIFCTVLFTIAAIVIAAIFMVGCLFCLTLKDLFKQAINFKMENELTI